MEIASTLYSLEVKDYSQSIIQKKISEKTLYMDISLSVTTDENNIYNAHFDCYIDYDKVDLSDLYDVLLNMCLQDILEQIRGIKPSYFTGIR